MKQEQQLRIEWVGANVAGESNDVALEPETIDAVVVLMARALMIVVRAVEEDADEG